MKSKRRLVSHNRLPNWPRPPKAAIRRARAADGRPRSSKKPIRTSRTTPVPVASIPEPIRPAATAPIDWRWSRITTAGKQTTNHSSSATMTRLAPAMSWDPWQQPLAVTVSSWVMTHRAMMMITGMGTCRKNRAWNAPAHPIQTTAPTLAPTTAMRIRVGRRSRSSACSPARKKAEAVGRPTEKTTPNSHGRTRNRAYSPTTVGPPNRATSRLATVTEARAPPWAPRLVSEERATMPVPAPRSRSRWLSKMRIGACLLGVPADDGHDREERPQEAEVEDLLVEGVDAQREQAGGQPEGDRDDLGETAGDPAPDQWPGPQHRRADQDQQAQQPQRAPFDQGSQVVVVGLVGVHRQLGGQGGLGGVGPDPEQAVGLVVELAHLRDELGALRGALGAAADRVHQDRLVAVEGLLPQGVEREDGEEARHRQPEHQHRRDQPGPAPAAVDRDQHHERDADGEREEPAVGLGQHERPEDHRVAGETKPAGRR